MQCNHQGSSLCSLILVLKYPCSHQADVQLQEKRNEKKAKRFQEQCRCDAIQMSEQQANPGPFCYYSTTVRLA